MPDETLPPEERPTEPLSDVADTPKLIGNYRLLEKAGEGGMGEVWLAAQESPVQRRVAVKLIKLGMDTKQVVARFEAERQALALMNHPNVAKVLDAGATPQGRPFFVMEYVSGAPIIEHCDRQRLTTRERLELFTQVCKGVQHAHRKGIIHRDIKPSNILVSVENDQAVPKIIDFGVAKATQLRLTERTLYTRIGAPVGTAEYMSPEQADSTGQDVDTRTDVYSLGVVLYELLVGALPFEPRQTEQVSLEELLRRIRDEEPSRPSDRIGASGERSAESAKRRRSDPSAWRRDLSGDLDWITMKALDKDRRRRYDSPTALAEDIERHLRDEPIRARPPSAGYRLGKFVKRHRVGVVASTALVLAAITGVAGLAIGLVRATRAEAEARRQATTSEEISRFMVDLFKVSDPNEARGNSITAREILDEGAARIGEELGDEPRVQATLMNTMGDVYYSLGLYDAARPLLERSLELRRNLQGENDEDVATSLISLGRLLRANAQFDEARPLFEQAIEIQTSALGADDPVVGDSLTQLAFVFEATGDLDEAERLHTRALEIEENALGRDDPDLARPLNNLAILFAQRGDFQNARPLFERSLAVQEKALGSNDPGLAHALNNLAVLLFHNGELEDARARFEQALEIREASLGPDHTDTAMSLNNLANVLEKLGNHDEARALNERALAIRERAFGVDHPSVAFSLLGLGNILHVQGELDEARSLYLRALRIREDALGPDHLHVAYALSYLARLDADTGDLVLARARFERAREITEQSVGSESPLMGEILYGLACVSALEGDKQTALALLRDVVKQGYADREIRDEPKLMSLRGDPEFERIVADGPPATR